MTSEFEYDDSSLDDDQLAMLFACCHPALAPEARMALTLRSVAGLTVPEIARAFLSSEAAMERRLGRARRKVTDARIPVSVPSDDLLPERLAGVLRVVYLIFTEGHGAVRGDLCEEAIRLARLLVRLMPDESEARGLLALLLLTDARRAARMADGELVALPEQDRSLWDAQRIEEGRALIGGLPGPYVIQAAISALHSTAPSWEATDWPQIAALYAELQRYDGSPVVAVNRAVAVGFADGPRAGLALLDAAAQRRAARPLPAAACGARRAADPRRRGRGRGLRARDRADRQRGRAGRAHSSSGQLAPHGGRSSARSNAARSWTGSPCETITRSNGSSSSSRNAGRVQRSCSAAFQIRSSPSGAVIPSAKTIVRCSGSQTGVSSWPRPSHRQRSPPGSSEPRRIGSSSAAGMSCRQYRSGP